MQSVLKIPTLIIFTGEFSLVRFYPQSQKYLISQEKMKISI